MKALPVVKHRIPPGIWPRKPLRERKYVQFTRLLSGRLLVIAHGGTKLPDERKNS